MATNRDNARNAVRTLAEAGKDIALSVGDAAADDQAVAFEASLHLAAQVGIIAGLLDVGDAIRELAAALKNDEAVSR